MGFLSVLLGLTQVARRAVEFSEVLRLHQRPGGRGFFREQEPLRGDALYAHFIGGGLDWKHRIAFGLEKNRNKFSTASIVSQLASFCILTVLIGAQVVTRSRAGMILTLGALFGAFLLIRQGQRATNGMRPTWLMVGAASLAVVLSFQFSLYRALDRFALETAPDAASRSPATRSKRRKPSCLSALGSALSFRSTRLSKSRGFDGWRLRQPRSRRFSRNLARNRGSRVDSYPAFCRVAAVRSLQVWRRSYVGGLQIDRFLVRASTLAILLLLFHSIADYPLRTGSMMALFAFLCALLIPPRDDLISDLREAARVARTPRPAPARPRADPTATAPPPRPPRQPAAAPRPARPKPVTAWDDEHWPEEWRRLQAGTFEGDGSGKAPEPSSEE